MPRLGLAAISSRSAFVVLAGTWIGVMAWKAATVPCVPHAVAPRPSCNPKPSTTEASAMLQRQPGCFVPNLGQWDHPAKFVHRNGPMTLFVEDNGWVLDLVERPARARGGPQEPGLSAKDCRAMPGGGGAGQKVRGVALRMTLEGGGVPEIRGEQKLPGHHNYFLGNDERRWRTGVPLYGSVRYEDLYPGIDLRLREVNGVPEYDLLLEPGADLSLVTVKVEGAQGLTLASNGSLVIETALGPVTQPKCSSWQVDADGRKQGVVCSFVLLGANRFGFSAPGWDGATCLTIDPGLIWSSYIGWTSYDLATAVDVHANGTITIAGATASIGFPTTTGAYDTKHNGETLSDAFCTVMSPNRTGPSQLIYSTFLGGALTEDTHGVAVDSYGVVTIAGYTSSTDFPTTVGAFDRTNNGPLVDVFVSRLDPSKTGAAQLSSSTFLGGENLDYMLGFEMEPGGQVTVTGNTRSTDFPTTVGAYDSTYNGKADVFVSTLDLSKSGSAQLVYSTLLGGSDTDLASAVSVDQGVITVAGYTLSTGFPVTPGAYDTTMNASAAGFVSRIDPRRSGSAQLVYSTYLDGGTVSCVAVSAGSLVIVAGVAGRGFPMTISGFDPFWNGSTDVFVSQLDLRRAGSAQLVYSTYLGGYDSDSPISLTVDAAGVMTIVGDTRSPNFPTTAGAHSTSMGGNADAFVSRIDPRRTGAAQLVYSSYFGGEAEDIAGDGTVDGSGVVTIVGSTDSKQMPTTMGAYDTSSNGSRDAFVAQLDMGQLLRADRHEVSVTSGGTQKLTLNAGKQHANRLYWVLGSATGTKPGVNLLGIHFPLNPDVYTDVTIGSPTLNPPFVAFTGKLDGTGQATASFNVPKRIKPLGVSITLFHAYLVYDNGGRIYMASNAVPLKLVK